MNYSLHRERKENSVDSGESLQGKEYEGKKGKRGISKVFRKYIEPLKQCTPTIKPAITTITQFNHLLRPLAERFIIKIYFYSAPCLFLNLEVQFHK